MRFIIWIILYGFASFSKGTIHFYENTNFEGEFYQIQFVPYGVHDIGDLNFGPTKSIRTSECVVLIEGTGQNDINLVVEPSGMANIVTGAIYAKVQVYIINKCYWFTLSRYHANIISIVLDSSDDYEYDPEKEGNLIRDEDSDLMDFKPTKFSLCEDYFGPKYTSRGVIVTFKSNIEVNVTLTEVNGCFSFPSSLGQVSRVYNFGNCVYIYETADCKRGGHVKLRGGTSTLSLKPTNSPKSLSHCGGCPNCIRFNATLQKLSLETDWKFYKNLTQIVDLGVKSRIVNAGPADIVQEYSASVDILQTIEIPLDDTLAEMNSVRISPDVEFRAPKNLTFLFGFLKATIKKAYKNRQFLKKDTTFKHERTKTITDTKVIAMKQCSTQSLESGYRVIQNFPINFTMLYHLSIADDTSYTDKFIQDHLPGGNDLETDGNLVFLEKVDDQTVLAEISGTMYVTYGKEAIVQGFARYLNYCPKHSVLKALPLP